LEVANAVGNAVDAFVKFGTVQGGFKKFAVEVVASIAQMSIVQAVFELAQGLAMSALAYFTGDANFAKSATFHYLSAAAFGAIGGIATIAGRGLAAATGYGNDQKQKAAVGSAAGGGSTSTQPVSIDVGRRVAANSSSDSSAHLAQAASDFRVAAADHLAAAKIMNAAANRIYGQTASDVVRAGAPGAYREIATALGNAFEQSHPIRSQILHGTPRGIG
jgi:hypothetical protein